MSRGVSVGVDLVLLYSLCWSLYGFVISGSSYAMGHYSSLRGRISALGSDSSGRFGHCGDDWREELEMRCCRGFRRSRCSSLTVTLEGGENTGKLCALLGFAADAPMCDEE